MNRHDELVQDSMFDEQFVTTAGEIEEAREALIQLGKDIVLRKMDASSTRHRSSRQRECSNGALAAANRHLFALFQKGWKKDGGLLFRCYREYKKRLCYHYRAEC